MTELIKICCDFSLDGKFWNEIELTELVGREMISKIIEIFIFIYDIKDEFFNENFYLDLLFG